MVWNFDPVVGGSFVEDRDAPPKVVTLPDTADTLLASSEGGPMAVYRIEKDLDGQTTDAEPWAVVEVTSTIPSGEQDGYEVETLDVLSTWATEDEAQTEVDRLVAAVSDDETLGGRPNQGTKKDKRLHENNGAKKGKKSALAQAIEFAQKQGGTVSQDDLDRLAADLGTVGRGNPAEQLDSALGVTAATKTAAPATAAWSGVLCVEGVTTGDQREFAKGALTWADPPIPLRWKKEDAHGGMNDVTVAVGSITSIKRTANRIEGSGVFDLGSADGREAYRRMNEVESFGGISIDADDITEADIEFIYPDSEATGDEDDLLMILFGSPDKILFHAGRIRAATLVDIPAFVEAKISLTASAVEVPSEGDYLLSAAALDEKVRKDTEHSTLTAAGVLPVVDRDAPPVEWFADPKLSVPMNVIVTNEGRVYGHAAHWDSCHIGHPEMCITAPYEDRHDYFMTGEMVCADGTRVKVGQITLGTGHAPLPYGASRAAEHYDNTGTAVADVTIGNDEHGIWVAGAVRPGTDPARVRELRASGKVSGDWRRIGGQLRMVGLLGVNVAGFLEIPQTRSRVASGQQLALVAAGMPKLGSGTVDEEQAAMRYLMRKAAERVHGTEET